MSEPAEAVPASGADVHWMPDAPADREPAGEGELPHSGHHHCPVAPDLFTPALSAAFVWRDAMTFARPIAALPSRSQAPPIQPPNA